MIAHYKFCMVDLPMVVYMKGNRRFVMLIAISAILVALYIYESVPLSEPAAFSINNRTYKLTEFAYTQPELEKGLMNATVTNTTFMLFNMGGLGIYTFWMKDTYSQLDIIWLNYSPSTGIAKVVYIANATPCVSYSPNQQNCIMYTPENYSNYVLEAKHGFVNDTNIRIGADIKLVFKYG